MLASMAADDGKRLQVAAAAGPPLEVTIYKPDAAKAI